MEVDVIPIATTDEETLMLANKIDGTAGEWSPFHELHGFVIQGVDHSTPILPTGWQDRLVRVQNRNTADSKGTTQFIGWCLNKEDLCVSKLCAFRTKDRDFVAALIDAGLVDSAIIAERLRSVSPEHVDEAQRGLQWLAAKTKQT